MHHDMNLVKKKVILPYDFKFTGERRTPLQGETFVNENALQRAMASHENSVSIHPDDITGGRGSFVLDHEIQYSERYIVIR